MVQKFDGFPPGKTHMIALPSQFFSDLLPLIDDRDELKLTLACLWALQQREGDFPHLRNADLTSDTMRAVHTLDDAALDAALSRMVERGTLLTAQVTIADAVETLYFANSPKGQAALRQIKGGKWRPERGAVEILPEAPSVYRLYEQNIGPLTAMIRDELVDTEREFGTEWLAEAIAISVENNKRSLRYIRAILERWKKDGKREVTEGRTGPDGEHYIRGKYADYIKR